MNATATVPSQSSRAPSPCLLLAAGLVVCFAPAHADVVWHKVRAQDLHALFSDHELADGVHYSYQFRGNGTFAGFNMGKESRGSWRIAGDEFFWTQKRRGAAEECFEVERSGASIRLLRDGSEAFAAKLGPVQLLPDGEAPR